jgi:hypothetical protein
LLGNYPNPFNGSTLIRFEINSPAEVEVRITNVAGQIVKVMRATFGAAGENIIGWDATDWQSRPVGSGIYFFTVKMTGRSVAPAAGKMLYIR